jgi:hypothetical protein
VTGAFGPDGEWRELEAELRASAARPAAEPREWRWLDHGPGAPVYAQAYLPDGGEAVDECWGFEPGTPRDDEHLALAAMSFEAAYGEEQG